MKKLTILGIFLCSLQCLAQKKAACCNEGTAMACKLTSAEFKERKATVITNLKKEIVIEITLAAKSSKVQVKLLNASYFSSKDFAWVSRKFTKDFSSFRKFWLSILEKNSTFEFKLLLRENK